jgi:acyl-CoA synthetase (AMP-forming)/AMP-acid ligase II
VERTIPNLLAGAVEAAADALWLLYEDAAFTYEQAWRRIATVAAGLADLGVGLIGQTEPRLAVDDAAVDRLMAPAGTNPPDAKGPLPDDPAVLIPTSGTTGRSKLVTQTHRAFVVLAAEAATDAPALHAWAADRLTRYKVPRYIEFVPELPHTPTGRVAKHRLPRERTPTEWDKETAGRG